MGREEEAACARKKQEREFFVNGLADELIMTTLPKSVYRIEKKMLMSIETC